MSAVSQVGASFKLQSKKTLPKSLHLTFWDFAGCTFKTQYGQKDMERHLKTHTGTCGCLALDGIPHVSNVWH